MNFLNEQKTVEILIDFVVNKMKLDHTKAEEERHKNDIVKLLPEDSNIAEFLHERDVVPSMPFVSSFIKRYNDNIRVKYKQQQQSFLYFEIFKSSINIRVNS